MITTIICNHNYGRFIKDAVGTALSQTVENRVVVVDDGSTDGSVDLIPSSVDLIKTNHVGPSQARNEAIKAFWDDTDVFAILDADDFWHIRRLETLLPYLNDQVGAVYSNYYHLYEDGNSKKEWKESFGRNRLLQECMVHSGCLITKEALLHAYRDGYFYDPQMRTCEDYDLWIRISDKFTIAHCPEFLAFVRVHSQNSTQSVKQEIWNYNWNRIREKL